MEANPSANVKFAIYAVTAYDSGISVFTKGKIDNKHMQAPLLFPQIINMQ
jgi:hypothetical protein